MSLFRPSILKPILILSAVVVVAGAVLVFVTKFSKKSDPISNLKRAMTEDDATRARGWFDTDAYTTSNYYKDRLNEIDLNHDRNMTILYSANATVDRIDITYSSQKVRDAAAAYLKMIEDQNTSEEEVYGRQVEQLMKKAAQLLPQAKTTKDLDSFIVEAQELGRRASNGMISQEMNRSGEKAREVEGISRIWQNYLFSLENDRMDEAAKDLRELADSPYNREFVPRSIILDRMVELDRQVAARKGSISSGAKIFEEIRTLEDMEPALKEITALQVPTHPDPENQRAILALQRNLKDYNAIKSGTACSITLGNPKTDPIWANRQLATQLLLLIFQHYFIEFKGEAPAPNELPGAFIERVIADAEARQDWDLFRKAVPVDEFMTRSSYFTTPAAQDPNGLDWFVAGLNQEAAGQFQLAVYSYQMELKSTGDHVPVKAIGSKLASLQKDHPDEFKAALQMVITSSNGPPQLVPTPPGSSADVLTLSIAEGIPSRPVSYPASSNAIPTQPAGPGR